MKFNIPSRKFWICTLVLTLVSLYTIGLPLKSVKAYTAPTTIQSADSLQFKAERRPEGIWLEWQATLAQPWTEFSVYHSADCQWENAVLVTAPIFSSTQSESGKVVYSLLDEGAVGQQCSYWITGTDGGGAQHRFGPAAVQARFGLYLPIVRR